MEILENKIRCELLELALTDPTITKWTITDTNEENHLIVITIDIKHLNILKSDIERG